MNNEILLNACIPESEWNNCYISDDGMIFTPLHDDNGQIIKTGEQMYNDYLESVENPTVPEPTEQEKINAMLMKELAALKAQVSAQ